jgi:hypothetical protein
MQPGTEINVVAHVIQQAVAPVFLLTGVAAMLGVLTNRLSRIIDRLRTLAEARAAARDVETAEPQGEHPTPPQQRSEVAVLGRRRAWIHRAIILCTVCALLVCVVIATLFLGAELGGDTSRLVSLLFVTAMASLIAGLLCFLHEIALATEAFESR